MDELENLLVEHFVACDLSHKARLLPFKDRMSYYKRYRESDQALKDWIKAAIKRWQAINSLDDCGNRIEYRLDMPYKNVRTEPVFKLGYVSLFSDKGSIGKSKWLNKITVSSTSGDVISHVARTDERFLGEGLPELFGAFIVGFLAELNKFLLKVWEQQQTDD